MEHKIEVRQMFDESFQRMVIEEYLATKCSKMELLRKYNIHFKSAIQTWMKKLGYEDTESHQRVKFDISPPLTLSMPTKSENVRELQKKIPQLVARVIASDIVSSGILPEDQRVIGNSRHSAQPSG
jgi:hemerythrin